MNDIRLDRQYYHLHEKIGAWCNEHFGQQDFYAPEESKRWYRNIMFGYQDYHFAEEADATFFTLYWIKR